MCDVKYAIFLYICNEFLSKIHFQLLSLHAPATESVIKLNKSTTLVHSSTAPLHHTMDKFKIIWTQVIRLLDNLCLTRKLLYAVCVRQVDIWMKVLNVHCMCTQFVFFFICLFFSILSVSSLSMYVFFCISFIICTVLLNMGTRLDGLIVLLVCLQCSCE